MKGVLKGRSVWPIQGSGWCNRGLLEVGIVDKTHSTCKTPVSTDVSHVIPHVLQNRAKLPFWLQGVDVLSLAGSAYPPTKPPTQQPHTHTPTHTHTHLSSDWSGVGFLPLAGRAHARRVPRVHGVQREREPLRLRHHAHRVPRDRGRRAPRWGQGQCSKLKGQSVHWNKVHLKISPRAAPSSTKRMPMLRRFRGRKSRSMSRGQRSTFETCSAHLISMQSRWKQLLLCWSRSAVRVHVKQPCL